MPPASIAEIKIAFTRTNMIPGPAGRIFQRDVLAYYTSYLGQFMQHPQPEHMRALEHVMGYILHNPDLGITFGGKLKIPFGLTAMPEHFIESKGVYAVSDSSWNTKAKPHGGHVVMRANGPIIWRSRAMKAIPDSTMHAEMNEASAAIKSTTFVRMALGQVKRPVIGPTPILGDNAAMHDGATKEGTSSKTRHFERATILIKYAVMRLMAVCYLVSTYFCIADVFTKATDEATFFRMRAVLRNEKTWGAGMLMHRVMRRAGF